MDKLVGVETLMLDDGTCGSTMFGGVTTFIGMTIFVCNGVWLVDGCTEVLPVVSVVFKSIVDNGIECEGLEIAQMGTSLGGERRDGEPKCLAHLVLHFVLRVRDKLYLSSSFFISLFRRLLLHPTLRTTKP